MIGLAVVELPEVSTARGLLDWYMRRCGFRGWASFWGAVYVLPGHKNNDPLLRHGYWSNPYEIEARAAELIPPRPPTT